MLYDPKWEPKTKDKSFASFIAWLETQPADAAYDYCNPQQCAVAKWLASMGEHPIIDVTILGQDFWESVNVPFADDWTYGKALERARKLAEHPFRTTSFR